MSTNAALKSDKPYTYADYLTWPEDKRYEIIDGVAYLMSSPTWQHQSVSMALGSQFHVYFENKPCRVFAAPFDVRLPHGNEKDEDCTTVVQPDLVVVCDKNKLKKTGCHGAPDLVIEIVSPSTSRTDRLLKYYRYEKAGVKEYWLVDPEAKIVSIVTLDNNGKYGPQTIYSEEDSVTVAAFPELTIDFKRVFAEI